MGSAGLARAPGADGVEILQREAERIHQLVAAGAGRAGAVRSIRSRSVFGAASVLRLERRHVGERRRRRRAEQVLENPLAAQHRRRAIGVRGHHQDRALAEQPAPRIVGRA